MNWRRIGIVAIAIAVLGGAGFLAFTQFQATEETPAAIETDVDSVSVTTDIRIVSAEGVVVPVEQAQLAFLSSGLLVEQLVSEGDVVAAGDPLLRLETIDQAIGVTQAETAVLQAQANVQTAQAGLMAAQAGFEAAQIGITAAEVQLALLTADPTPAQIAASEANVAAAQAGILQAAGSRDVALEGGGSAAIAAAEARLVAAQTQFDNAVKQYQPILQNEEITDEAVKEQAALQLNSAQANLDAARAALTEAQNGATGGERTAAQAGVSVATNQRDAAQAQLDLLLAGPREEQIAVTETAVLQAQNSAAEAELQVVAAETAVAQAEAALQEAEAARQLAQTALDQRTLTAPFAGVVASITAKEGQVIAPGTPVLILADTSRWQIDTTDLTELSVVTIARGFEAEVTIDAYPGATLTAEVVDIADQAELVRGDVTYQVTLDLTDTADLALRWGMTAFVTIDTEQE